MTGEQLKKRIVETGYSLSEVAKMIGMVQQNFSQSLSAKDIKTGLVERIAEAMGRPISFFFDEPSVNHAVASGDSSVAAINSSVEGSAVLKERVHSLEELVEQKDKLIEEKERTIKILMGKNG